MGLQQTKLTPVPGNETKEEHRTSDLKPPAMDERVRVHAISAPAKSHPGFGFDFKYYVPYYLGPHNSGLFPDFYFLFKKNFSKESVENAAYCELSEEEFREIYVGSEQEIQSSVERVEAEFSMKFRQCLHPDLRKQFSEWTFSRSRVETDLRENLEHRKDLVSESLRRERLSRQFRKDFRAEPLVEYLIAFGYPESLIWTHLIQALGISALDHQKNRNALNAAAVWKSEPGTLARRAQAFADSYKAAASIKSTASGENIIGLFFPFFIFFVFCQIFELTVSFENLFLCLLLIFTTACASLFVWFIAIVIRKFNAMKF